MNRNDSRLSRSGHFVLMCSSASLALYSEIGFTGAGGGMIVNGICWISGDEMMSASCVSVKEEDR